MSRVLNCGPLESKDYIGAGGGTNDTDRGFAIMKKDYSVTPRRELDWRIHRCNMVVCLRWRQASSFDPCKCERCKRLSLSYYLLSISELGVFDSSYCSLGNIPPGVSWHQGYLMTTVETSIISLRSSPPHVECYVR